MCKALFERRYRITCIDISGSDRRQIVKTVKMNSKLKIACHIQFAWFDTLENDVYQGVFINTTLYQRAKSYNFKSVIITIGQRLALLTIGN